MQSDIIKYHLELEANDREICENLYSHIQAELKEAESKVWHGHPVWFINGNPIVGYSKQKAGIRLMFWSGADFEENGLNMLGKKFKDASKFYQNKFEIDPNELKIWLQKSILIQWDYKNIVKRKGRLEKLNLENYE